MVSFSRLLSSGSGSAKLDLGPLTLAFLGALAGQSGSGPYPSKADKSMKTIHYADIFRKITLRRGVLDSADEPKFRCKAKNGAGTLGERRSHVRSALLCVDLSSARSSRCHAERCAASAVLAASVGFPSTVKKDP